MASAGIGRSVEGIHAVGAALSAGRVEVRTVEERRMSRGPVADLISLARAAGADVRAVPDVRDHAATAAPQGVVATCRPIPSVSVDRLAEDARPAIVVVDRSSRLASSLDLVSTRVLAARSSSTTSN